VYLTWLQEKANSQIVAGSEAGLSLTNKQHFTARLGFLDKKKSANAVL